MMLSKYELYLINLVDYGNTPLHQRNDTDPAYKKNF